jgi:hypothetical protein
VASLPFTCISLSRYIDLSLCVSMIYTNSHTQQKRPTKEQKRPICVDDIYLYTDSHTHALSRSLAPSLPLSLPPSLPLSLPLSRAHALSLASPSLRSRSFSSARARRALSRQTGRRQVQTVPRNLRHAQSPLRRFDWRE